MRLRCKYIFFIFGLLLCHIYYTFAREESIIQEDFYINKLREDKTKISEMLFNKPENIYLKKSNSDLIQSLQENFSTYLVNNYSPIDFIPFFNPGVRDYFENRKYEFDKQKYSNIPKCEIANEIIRFFFKSLFSDDNEYNLDNDTLQDSLYYDLCQSNSDLRLFDEKGGLIESLLGEENKDNVVLKYLLSQAIMNATNKHNDDRQELLNLLMREGDTFDNVYKKYCDLTQYASLFRLFEQGDMFNKFGLPSDLFTSLLHGRRKYKFFAYGKSYFDEESMEWVTEKIIFTNDGIKNTKDYNYNFLDNINPLILIGKYIGNKTFMRLLKKYFFKSFFTLIVLTFLVRRNIEIIKSYVFNHIGINVEGFWLNIVLIVCLTVLTHLVLYNAFSMLKILLFIIKFIFWYPVKNLIVNPIRNIFEFTDQTTIVFIICVYLFLLFLLYHFIKLSDYDLVIYLKFIANQIVGLKTTDTENVEQNKLQKYMSKMLCMFLDNKIVYKGIITENNFKYYSAEDLGIFPRFCLSLLKFLTHTLKQEKYCLKIFGIFAFIKREICFLTIYLLLWFVCFFILLPFADYNDFQDYPYVVIYDFFYSDVVKVEQLDCMHEKKCIIENFINDIKSFLENCEKSDTLSSILSENFKYKNNFMTTLDLWNKMEYGQIKYNYSEDVNDNISNGQLNKNGDIDIESTNVAIGNMFRYLDRCNSFDIDEYAYKKYSMEQISDFLSDYTMFFYYFISSYKFFKSAIKDIYKLGIYLYPVYLAKHRGFCIANFRQGKENEKLSLEIKDSKNILLGEQCVPNDIVFDNNCQNIIFNGLNGAGKTIFLSQAILNVILAQSLGVAYAKSYKGDIVDKIVTSFSVDINIDVANSKFMQELLNMNKIYTYIDVMKRRKRILFALDEICSGTDPESGELIVKNFFVALMSLGCNVVAATHYNAPREIHLEYPEFCCWNYVFDFYVNDSTGEIIYNRKAVVGVPKFSLSGAVVKNLYLEKLINKKFYDAIIHEK